MVVKQQTEEKTPQKFLISAIKRMKLNCRHENTQPAKKQLYMPNKDTKTSTATEERRVRQHCPTPRSDHATRAGCARLTHPD